MATNLQVIETIADTGLLLPQLITEALAANDRIKYYLTVLQAAHLHARQPLQPAPDLRATRQSSGVPDAALDDVPDRSRLVSDDIVFIPGAERIRGLLFDDLQRMIEPLRAAAGHIAESRVAFDQYQQRLATHVDAVPSCTDDHVPASTLDALTSAGDERHDTVHRLVMDLHRVLNRMLADVAVDSVDGARTMALAPGDRPLVAAFMRGLNATAPLKFDHPGLGTTAARYGERLSIQNDLGTTEGHIVIVQIDGLTATIIYSDVHVRRIRFFQDLLQEFAIDWQPAAAAAAGPQMIVGRFTAADRAALEQFLRFFGSQLVFLIDWNRARKRLARFVRKPDATDVLKWAAGSRVGHRAFLQAGDVRLIYTAFERIAPSRIRYGARLDELLGRDAAIAFLKAVLRIAAGGLQAGHSTRLIQDEVEAELLTHLATTERDILDSASDHAMMIAALAERVRRTLVGGPVSPAAAVARAAGLAKAWESRADDMVRNASRAIDRTDAARLLSRLLGQADEAADALEEAAFLATLLPQTAAPEAVTALRPLSDLITDITKEYVRCLEHAKERSRFQTPSDVQNALVSVDRIAELEHACDTAERAARTTLIRVCGDFRELHVLSDIVHRFEETADALARCARLVRDYVLNPEAGDS